MFRYLLKGIYFAIVILCVIGLGFLGQQYDRFYLAPICQRYADANSNLEYQRFVSAKRGYRSRTPAESQFIAYNSASSYKETLTIRVSQLPQTLQDRALGILRYGVGTIAVILILIFLRAIGFFKVFKTKDYALDSD
jgi:hypothetical protein